MKSTLIWRLSTIVLAVAMVITFPLVLNSDKSFGEPPQPMMDKALANLEQAKANLKAATPNKGGHLLKALHHVNVAIREVKLGKTYAATH